MQSLIAPEKNSMRSLGTFNWSCDSQESKYSRRYAIRSAWLLISPAGTFLQRLAERPEWTSDPSEAMSWLDPVEANRLLTLALPSAGVLVRMTFKADANSFPLKWTPVNE